MKFLYPLILLNIFISSFANASNIELNPEYKPPTTNPDIPCLPYVRITELSYDNSLNESDGDIDGV